MFERFTDRSRRAVVLAQEAARERGAREVTSTHMVAGLLAEGEGVAAKALGALGVSREQFEWCIPDLGVPSAGHIPFTHEVKHALELSLREALQLAHSYIGTEHLLLGLVRADKDGLQLGAFGILDARFRVTPGDVRAAVIGELQCLGVATDPVPRPVIRLEPGVFVATVGQAVEAGWEIRGGNKGVWRVPELNQFDPSNLVYARVPAPVEPEPAPEYRWPAEWEIPFAQNDPGSGIAWPAGQARSPRVRASWRAPMERVNPDQAIRGDRTVVEEQPDGTWVKLGVPEELTVSKTRTMVSFPNGGAVEVPHKDLESGVEGGSLWVLK